MNKPLEQITPHVINTAAAATIIESALTSGPVATAAPAATATSTLKTPASDKGKSSAEEKKRKEDNVYGVMAKQRAGSSAASAGSNGIRTMDVTGYESDEQLARLLGEEPGDFVARQRVNASHFHPSDVDPFRVDLSALEEEYVDLGNGLTAIGASSTGLKDAMSRAMGVDDTTDAKLAAELGMSLEEYREARGLAALTETQHAPSNKAKTSAGSNDVMSGLVPRRSAQPDSSTSRAAAASATATAVAAPVMSAGSGDEKKKDEEVKTSRESESEKLALARALGFSSVLEMERANLIAMQQIQDRSRSPKLIFSAAPAPAASPIAPPPPLRAVYRIEQLKEDKEKILAMYEAIAGHCHRNLLKNPKDLHLVNTLELLFLRLLGQEIKRKAISLKTPRPETIDLNKQKENNSDAYHEAYRKVTGIISNEPSSSIIQIIIQAFSNDLLSLTDHTVDNQPSPVDPDLAIGIKALSVGYCVGPFYFLMLGGTPADYEGFNSIASASANAAKKTF